MKTKVSLMMLGIGMMLNFGMYAQSNFNVTLPAGQEVRNLSGNICCFYRVNVATDEAGNAYVLSEQTADSSMWVTKYDNNGNMIYNTRVGFLGYETNYHYIAKKIKVYDRVYILSRTMGPIGNNPNYWESETVYTMDKNTGIVDQTYANFIPYPGHTDCKLIDLVQAGNTICMIGQTISGSGPGSVKIHVMRTDLTWTGNLYLLGNAPSTDYYLNTESNCSSYYNGALYLTGEASAGPGSKIFITKLDVWGFISEYLYTNAAYAVGGKGLGIAAEGNSVYVAGGLRAQVTKPVKTTVMKIDTSLTAPAWVNISKSSEWPLGLGLSSTDVIYTVDYTLKVVGFSKSTGNQLFAKNDFKSYAQVYNQPISTAVLNNNQLIFQASVGVNVKGNATINKLTAKYSITGMKVYQQLEALTMISPGNPGSAEALGMSYSAGANYIAEVYRKSSSDGTLFYVNGKSSPTSLRIMQDELTDETGGDQLFTLFPNPAQNYFKINSSEKISGWKLFDSLMRLASQSSADGNELEINCSTLGNGMYIIQITTESGNVLTKKLVISRQDH